jgi:hypothetical protein
MKGISKTLKPVVILLMLSLLIACINDTDPVVAIDEDVNISGDWKTGCKINSEDGTSTIDSFKFSNNNFKYQEHLYSDDSCNQFIEKKTRAGKITHRGTKPKETLSGKKAHERDFLFNDGEEWKSLVALEDDEDKNTTLYLAPGYNGAARPDDFTGEDVYTLNEGTVEPPPRVDIDGNWKTECLYSENDKLGYIFIFNFSEDRFSYQRDQYSDSSCANSKDSRTRSGKVRYGEKLTTPSGRTAYELDLLFDDGNIVESLVARQGDTIILNPGSEGASRPDDLTGGLEFSKDSGPVSHVDIDGTWKMDCIYFEDDELGVILIFKVSGERFSFQTNFYPDNSCSQLKASALDEGKVTYGKEITTPSGLTAHEIDLKFTKGDGIYTGTWKSLVARDGSSLRLDGDTEGSNRPIDFRETETIVFTKQ